MMTTLFLLFCFIPSSVETLRVAPAKPLEILSAPTLASLAEIKEGDVFYDLGSGDGRIPITYLSNKLNLILRPKLLRELRPGSRILSHDFQMGDWEAERMVRVPWEKGPFRTVYFWRVPAGGIKARAKRSR